MTSTDTLLPCPFCGGEARLDAQTHMGRNYVGVICLDCGLWQDTRSPDIIGAIAAWNRRTPPTPATEDRHPLPGNVLDCDEAVKWITSNCMAIRRDNGEMDYSLGAMIAAFEAGRETRAAEILAAEANVTARIVAWLDETAWLLERDYFGQLRYFSAACQDEAPTDWTPDNLQALRFARRIDAERFASREATDCIDIRVVEHMWCAIEHGAGK